MDRQEALTHIAALCRDHHITSQEVGEILALPVQDAATGGDSHKRDIFSRIFSYIGGILIFSGLCVYVGMFWGEMSSVSRVIITFGGGMVAYLIAVAASFDERYKRAATPLFLMAILLQPTGILVMIHEYFDSGSDPRYATLFAFGFMLLQQGATFISRRLTVNLFAVIAFGTAFFINLLDLVDAKDNFVAVSIGISLLCVAWLIRNSIHHPLTGVTNLIGGGSLFSGVFDMLKREPYEILFLALAAFMIYVSTVSRSRMLLTVSTVAMMGYIAYFSAENFADSVGWPITLILTGFLFVGIGSAAVRISRKYIRG